MKTLPKGAFFLNFLLFSKIIRHIGISGCSQFCISREFHGTIHCINIPGSSFDAGREIMDSISDIFVIVKIDYFFHVGELKSSNEGEIEIIYPDDNNGNLYFDGYFRESFFLAQPLRSLCKEDCRGLCQICGADLNKKQCGCKKEEYIDPRWEKLTDLIKKNK